MRKISKFEKRRSVAGYIFLSPWIFATLFLLIYPVIFSLMLSFGEIKSYITYSVRFVGVNNYREAFIVDDRFLPMLFTSISDMLINTPMILIFSLLVAIILNRKIRFRAGFRRHHCKYRWLEVFQFYR